MYLMTDFSGLWMQLVADSFVGILVANAGDNGALTCWHSNTRYTHKYGYKHKNIIETLYKVLQPAEVSKFLTFFWL